MSELTLRDKRILVTGGAGFLGRHVCHLLRDRGPVAVVVPRSADCDLTEQADVRRLFREERPEVVVHLAAEVGGIGANRANPGRYWYANQAMGLHLLEESRRAGVAKYLQVGTVCSYPNDTPVPFREESLWDGYPEVTNAPYGVAKKSLYVGADAYARQYGLSAVTVLPVNLYGPHDNFDLETSHVIPALIRKAVEARDAGADSLPAWGGGTASREFLFVRDAAEGVVAALERLDDPAPVNLGSGREIVIRELAELICEVVGFRGRIEWDASKPDGQPRRCLDTARAADLLGWRAATDFRDGLAETAAWYEANRESVRELPLKAAA